MVESVSVAPSVTSQADVVPGDDAHGAWSMLDKTMRPARHSSGASFARRSTTTSSPVGGR